MGLHETVEEGEVLLRAVGHGDSLQVATLDERERIDLPLGDVAHRLVDQRVDVPRDQLTLGMEGKPLVEGTVFHVDVVAPVEERKGDGTLQRVARLVLLLSGLFRRERGVGQRDAVTLQQVEVELALLGQEADERLRVGCLQAVVDEKLRSESLGAAIGALASLFAQSLLSLLSLLGTRFLLTLRGHIARFATMVAVIEALVGVHAEASLMRTMGTVRAAEGTCDAYPSGL